MARRFWLPVGHATELAARILTEAGWTPAADGDWQLAWTLDPPQADTFTSAAQGRWINHIPGIEALTTKHHLCLTLRAAAARAASLGVAAPAIAPETFVLPGEWNEWMRVQAWDPDAVWIQKPADMSRGRGVALVVSPEEVKGGNLVVQRYISNPHLIDGFKYTLRFYVLIVSLDPLIAYLFDDGFMKLASRPFSLAAHDRADRFRHLTNPDILRDDPNAEGVSTRNTTHPAYRRRLREAGADDERLWRDIRRALTTSLGAALPYLRASERALGVSSAGQFELMGIDIGVDDHLRPWLIECNLSPSLSVEASPATTSSQEEAAIKTRVIQDTLALVGANTEASPPALPVTAEEARARLEWHDQRRGRFDRLWPSREALDVLAGVEDLGTLDLALIEQEAAANWPAVAVNAVDTIDCDGETILYERRHDRISLLDREEAAGWRALTGVNWLREGLLVPADHAPAIDAPADPPIHPRRRLRWNREHVFNIHGLRVAITCATPRQETAIQEIFGWWEAGHEDAVDVTLTLTPNSSVSRMAAQVDRLALAHLGGVVRRPLRIAEKAGAHALVLRDDSDSMMADGWTVATRHVVVGGSPFGFWIDGRGTLTALPVASVFGHSRSRADLLLDLVSDGPGVIRVRDAAAIRRLAEWIATVPLLFRPIAGN